MKIRKRWDIKSIKEYVKENSNAELLSNEYKNRNSVLKFRCECGNEFDRSWRVFLRGSYNCRTCAWIRVNANRTYTVDFVREFAEKNSKSRLISEKYKNCKEDLTFKCNCGNLFVTPFDTFKNANKRKCNDCSMSDGIKGKDGQIRPRAVGKTNDEFLVDLKEARGNEFTPLDEYVNAKISIRVRHKKCKNVWEVTPDHLINRKDDCPYCAKYVTNSRGTRRIQSWLIANKVDFEREKTFPNLKGYKNQNNLRFDFYLPHHNICIEYDGQQHFRPIPIFGGKEAYRLQVLHDRLKDEFCKENKIKLIRIPYYKKDLIESLLNKSIPSQAHSETVGRCRD